MTIYSKESSVENEGPHSEEFSTANSSLSQT